MSSIERKSGDGLAKRSAGVYRNQLAKHRVATEVATIAVGLVVYLVLASFVWAWLATAGLGISALFFVRYLDTHPQQNAPFPPLH